MIALRPADCRRGAADLCAGGAPLQTYDLPRGAASARCTKAPARTGGTAPGPRRQAPSRRSVARLTQREPTARARRRAAAAARGAADPGGRADAGGAACGARARREARRSSRAPSKRATSQAGGEGAGGRTQGPACRREPGASGAGAGTRGGARGRPGPRRTSAEAGACSTERVLRRAEASDRATAVFVGDPNRDRGPSFDRRELRAETVTKPRFRPGSRARVLADCPAVC